MVKFIFNRKSLMTFGKWSLALFSLTLLGYFIFAFILPAIALGTPTLVPNVTVSLSTPANGTYTSSSNVNFTYNVSWDVGFNLTNCTLWGNFTGNPWAGNVSNVTDSLIVMNNSINGLNTSLIEGRYDWNVYCYNASSDGNYSEITSNPANYTITVDLTDPILNTTTPGKNSYISGNDSELFQVYVYDTYLNRSNATLYYQESGAGSWLSASLTCYNQSSPLFICNATVDNLNDNYGETAQIDFYFEATDNATRWKNNGTAASPISSIIDRTAPALSSDTPKFASGQQYDTSNTADYFGFQTGVSDGSAGISKVIFEANFSGTWNNTTASNSTVGTFYVNFSQSQFDNATAGYAYRWYSNDSVTPNSSANWVKGSFNAYSFTKADNPVTLQINDTNTTSNLTVIYGASINATVLDRGATSNEKLYIDGTETSEGNITHAAKTAGYNFTANTTGNANYSSNATSTPSLFVIINRATPAVTVFLNGSSANFTIANDYPVNITVNASNVQGSVFIYKDGDLANESTGVSNVTNITIHNGTTGQVFNITGYYNQSENYSAATPVEYYIVVETIAPTYSNLAIINESSSFHNVSNNTVIGRYGGNFNISAQWSDTYTISHYWFANSTNDGSSFTNSTPGIAFATGNWSNVTIHPNTYSGGTVLQFRVYVNDTSNNTNTTPTYRYTIDGTTPVLNNTNLVNNSYLTRSATQLFQIYAYDDTFNKTNATLYFKKSTAGSWNSSSMNCFDGSSRTERICNFSADLAVYGDASIIYYYFEASDNSSLLGANGSSSNPHVATLDILSPTYALNATNRTIIGQYDGIKIYANWTDATDTLDTYIFEFVTSTGEAWNVTEASFGGGTWSNLSYANTTGDWVAGTQIQFKIYANDTVPNWNVTTPVNFSIDNSVPTFETNGTNVTSGTTIGKSNHIKVYANWTDNLNVSNAWVQENITDAGTTANTSLSFITLNYTNHSFDTSSLTAGSTYTARIFINDTSGNENVTAPLWSWTVDNTQPNYTNNGTNVTQGETIPNGTKIKIYANWTDSVALHGWWVEHNQSGSSSLANTTFTTSFGAGNWTNTTINVTGSGGQRIYARIYVNDTSGNENVTAPIWNWTIDGTAPNPSNKSDSVDGEDQYNPGGSYILNISWNDDLGGGNITEALCNFSSLTSNQTATNHSFINYSVTISDLAVGNYSYRWYGIDTSNNTNSTPVYTLNITANLTNPVDIYLINTSGTFNNTNVTESAGISITVNATSVYGNETELKLYRNNTQVSNPYIFTPSSAAVYAFNASIATTNYTTNTTEKYYLTLTEDTTAPTVLLSNYTNGTARISGSLLALNINITDGTGVSDGDPCNVTINGTLIKTITYDESSGWCNGSITVPSVSYDGNFTINVTVNDNSTNANLGYNDSYVLAVDNSTPVITISTPSNASYKTPDSNGLIWINGTAIDNIKMGTVNVSINSTDFTVHNFTGGNNTAFAFKNSSGLTDGHIVLVINYTDNATNTGEAMVDIYVDNTNPTTFNPLTTGAKINVSSQTVQVNVTDNLMTNETITLHYKRGSLDISWQSTTMTGTVGTTTTYSGTVDTSSLGSGEIIYYYVTGVDNATNPFSTNNGTAANPLSYFSIGSNDTGAVDGYIFLTNTTIVPNSTVNVIDGTGGSTVIDTSSGYYNLSGLTAGTYTITASGNGYLGNSTSATVTAGSITQANMTVTGTENFNITLPGTSGTSTNGFWDIGWHDFYFATRLYSEGTTNQTVERLFLSMGTTGGYNYTAVWRYNATAQSWISFIPRTTGNQLINVSSSDDHYWVYANATDRVELEARYIA